MNLPVAILAGFTHVTASDSPKRGCVVARLDQLCATITIYRSRERWPLICLDFSRQLLAAEYDVAIQFMCQVLAHVLGRVPYLR